MKTAIIKTIDIKNKSFSIIDDNKKVNYYLTKRLSKLFMLNIRPSYLIKFEHSKRVRLIEGKKYYQVLNINLIKNTKYNDMLYDINQLRKDMAEFLKEQSHYLFLDLEMTIPYIRQKNFKHEIIQYGYFLVNDKGDTIKSKGNYVESKIQYPISKRTLRFLNIDRDLYENNKISYNEFYDELRDIIKEYNPKIVVWGKNDIQALDVSYEIHYKYPLTNSNDFIDLLKLHKDYFNLSNDIGLFNTYQKYYNDELVQIHDAKDDARVTKKVFDAFYNNIT